MSISNSDSRTAEASPRTEHSTALRAGSVGVMGILFFVLSAQAPLTGIVGASPLAAALGNGRRRARRVSGGGHRHRDLRRRVRRDEPEDPGQRRLLRLCDRRLRTEDRRRSGVARAPRVQHGPGRDVRAVRRGVLGRSSASAGIVVPWWLLAVVTMAGVQVLGSLNIELGARVLAVLVGLEVAILLMFGFTVLLRGGGPEGLSLAASFSPAGDRHRRPGRGHHVRCRLHVRLRIHGHLLGRGQGRPPHGGPGHVSVGGGHRGLLLLHFVDAGQLLRPLARHRRRGRGPRIGRLHLLRADADGGAVRAVGRNRHRHPARDIPAGRHHRLPQRHQPLPPFAGPARVDARRRGPDQPAPGARRRRADPDRDRRSCSWRRSPCCPWILS